MAIGAGALLVVVAAGVLLGGGAFGPRASPSPSPTTVAAASNSPGVSPTQDVFPNAAETALLRALPPDLRQTCSRGPYDEVQAEQGNFATPGASLTCSPGIASGANEVVARTFTQRTGSTVNGDFNTESAISYIMGSRGLRPGDCATHTRVGGRWMLNAVDVGAIACFVDSTTGDAVLYWSYRDAFVLIRATNQRGDSTALYAYFQSIARFISP